MKHTLTIKYQYKMLDLGCLVKENRNNEINNLFKYLKGYARKV